MRRFIACLLTFILIFGMTACRKKENTDVLPSPPSKTEGRETAETEPVSSAAPTGTSTPVSEKTASEAFDEFDRSFFTELLKDDFTGMHQMVKDPSSYGIDISKVERTLGSFSKESNYKSLKWARDMLAGLKEINRSELDERKQLAYDTISSYLEDVILSCSLYYGYDEILNEYTGLQADLPLVFLMFEIENRQDALDYLELMADVPRFVDEIIAYEQYRAELGLFMTEHALDSIIGDLDDVIDKGDDLFLVNTYKEAVNKLTDISDEEKNELISRNNSLVSNEFHNSFVKLKDELQKLKGKCRENVGLCDLNVRNIVNYYDFKLKDATGDHSADVDNTLNLLFSKYVSMTVTAMQSMNAVGSGDFEHFSLGNTDENLDYLHKVMDPMYPDKPSVDLTYVTVPKDLEEIFSPAAYLTPAFDDWQHNRIILNKPEQDDSLLFTLAHEALNGHMYQYTYHRSMKDLPLSQQILETTAYAEAWSQFSESMLAFKNTNGIDTDKKKAFFCSNTGSTVFVSYLSVVIHAGGYTEEEIIAYLSNSGYPEEQAHKLYDFLVASPFYYLPYGYGYTKLSNYHETASETLGGRFLEKDFIKTILDYGPTYFELINARFDSWLNGKAG